MSKKGAGQLRTRSLSLRLDAGGRPASLDEAARSVEVVGATETDEVMAYDFELGGYAPEILLMSGCRIPDSGKVVLLDTHSRFGTADVVGSYREMHIEADKVVGRAVFSGQPEGESAFAKLKEGHLTDFSMGYRVNAYARVEAGKTAVIEGRSFRGPALVATDWTPRELSICPIGADPNAKARGARRNTDMDERLRQYLEARGLAADADEAAAWAYLQTLDTRSDGSQGAGDPAKKEPETTVPDAGKGDAGRAEGGQPDAGQTERTRCMEIMGMGKEFGCAELAEKLIKEAVPADQARAAVLQHLAAKQRGQMPGHQTVDLVATERDKFRAAMGDALILRAGIAVAKPAPGSQDLRGLTLREASRESLRMAGLSIPANPMEMVGRALTSTDLPILLGNVARLSLMQGYQIQTETYPAWVDDTGQVSDFKIHAMARAGEADDLDEIPEAGEYQYGSQDETKETYQIVKFGKLFAISREAIINDDLGVMTDIPRNHGEAAARKIGDIAYAVLIANGKMGDGKALFHADHKNLMAAGSLSVATLGAGETSMQLQKDIRGKRRLNIQPRFLLAPVSKKTQFEQFFATQLIGGEANQPNLTNPWYGERLARVYEPRLDDDSLVSWYLAGEKGRTVRLFFLNGVKEPYLETRQGWSVDGTEFKVRLEAGAKALDWRTLNKNPGA